MDGSLVLLLLVAGLYFLLPPVLAIIALVRVRRLERRLPGSTPNHGRLAALERELKDLRRRVDVLGESDTAPAAAEQPGAAATGADAAARESGQTPSGESSQSPAGRKLRATPSLPPDVTPSGSPPAASAVSDASEPGPPAMSPAGMPAAGPPPVSSTGVNWERWIGIRGAALLGAVVLGLAGLLFFKYSIEHALITPAMRVLLGTLTGLACVGASGWLRARGYRSTSDGLAGAGVLILYAAFWSAHVLYALIGMTLSFGLMIVVTITCCLLALRRNSLIIAVLGLVGGFVTPLLLSSGADRPIGLFGYILLLDLGLLTIGHKRNWPSLGILSLLGTVALQALWVGGRMGPDRVLLGLAILAVFSVLFAVSGGFAGDDASRRRWRWSQVGAIYFPFAFAVYFASRVELGPHLYPIAILLAMLCVAAGWMAHQQSSPSLAAGAATASVTVVGVWSFQHWLTASLAWETAAVAVGLPAIFNVLVRRETAGARDDGSSTPASIAAGGFFVVSLLAAATARVAPWPWLFAWTVLAGLLYRQAARTRRGRLQVAGAIGLGLGLSILHLWPRPVLPPVAVFLVLLVVAAVATHGMARLRERSPVGRLADHAAAVLPVVLLLGLVPAALDRTLGPQAVLGTSLALGLLAMLAATRLTNGAWAAAAVGATGLVHLGWTWLGPGLRGDDSQSLAAFAVQMLAVVIFTLWPLVVVKRFSSQRLAWAAAALAGPLWFSALRHLFVLRFGDGFIGILPVALGALTGIAAVRARRVFAPDDPLRVSVLAWFAGVSVCFLAVAIPLQLEKEWVTIGWALEGLAVVALWKRLDHPGLKYLGLALLCSATLRLVANPALLGYHSHSTWRIVNWLFYTYLVPAGAMLGCAALLRPDESRRARPWEQVLYARGSAPGAGGSALAAIVVIFVWINLAVADWFNQGQVLTLSFGDTPAQRLTVSIAWAVYALVLLGIGISRKTHSLRWLSLGFLLVTIGKVFLYDLGALTDLYRVASLVGLAVSLIAVSLLYQRFVFRPDPPGELHRSA